MRFPFAASSYVWTPPSPGDPSQVPSLRSEGSSRGVMVNLNANRRMVFTNDDELSVAVILLARRDVVALCDQPPAVRYVDTHGVQRDYTCGYLATMVDGETIAIAVKPVQIAQRDTFIETLELIARQIPRAFADSVTLMTELDCPAWLVANSVSILSVNRQRERDDVTDNTVLAIVANIQGAVLIGDIVEMSGLAGRAFRSIIRLISKGALVAMLGKRFDYDVYVSKNAAFFAGTGALL